MNLTSQYIANPKSRVAYIESLATYKSIRITSTRLSLSDDRYVLVPNRNIYFKIDNIYFKMIRCPSGVFKMGKNNILTKIERPFLLGETEVMQELFQLIMGYNPSRFQGNEYPSSNQRPVENITLYDALMFCNKLSEKLGKRPYYNISNEQYIEENNKILPNIESAKVTINLKSNGFRLPLEKEWEYAAKAGTDNQWPGTNEDNKVKEIAWFKFNSNAKTHPVKCKRPNEWGFYDMSGNVWEWCYDLYRSTSDSRVRRGGGWYEYTTDLHSAYRYHASPGCYSNDLGFRVSASLVN